MVYTTPSRKKKISISLNVSSGVWHFYRKPICQIRNMENWADKAFFSSHSSGRKRGVLILINRMLNFTVTSFHKDSEGRYVLVNGVVDGICVSLCNIYTPMGTTLNILDKFLI